MRNISWDELSKNKDVHSAILSRLENDKTLLGEVFTCLRKELEGQLSESEIISVFCCICDYFGGTQVYFPSGDSLKNVVTGFLIYKEFNGKNVHELVKKYKSSEQHIYRLVEKHRNAEREARNQVEQFKSL